MQRIFVVGKNRSGTKWLSNLIANHSQVAALQRPGAGGIMEVNEISIVPKVFGPPEIDENYLGFLAFFEKTNYFKISGLGARILFETRDATYSGFLSRFMDKYAQSRGRSAWLLKSSSFSLENVLRDFPDAKVIVINRNVEDNIASTLALHGSENIRKRLRDLVREVWSYAHHKKLEDEHRNNARVMFTSFEELSNDKEAVCRSVCRFLALEFEKEVLMDTFEPNTSFSAGLKRENVLRRRERKLVSSVFFVIKFFPLAAFNLARSIRLCLRHGRLGPRTFQQHTFSLWTGEIDWQ